jgi:hypothetical protein
MAKLPVGSKGGKENDGNGYAPCIGIGESSSRILRKGKLSRMTRSLGHQPLCVLTCVGLTLAVSACEDVANDPLAMAVAPETHGAVLLSESLPTLSDLLAEHGLAAPARSYLDTWWSSWELGPQDGPRVRATLYSPVSAVLFPYLLEEGVAALLTENERALKAAHAVELLLVADAVDAAMENAWRYHELAVDALGRGMGELSLSLALRSADAVREVSPEQVARALLRQAEEALRRNRDVVPYSEEELIRIRRLTTGAEEALESGDYPRAIRRAYYACQLLGVGPA